MAEYKEHKVEGQINLGWNLSFAPSAAVPMIAKRLWDTLEQATLYAKNDPTAIAGLILTVSKDTEDNNGVYYVKAIGENAVLQKVGSNISLEGYATEQWVKDQNYLTEHQDLSDYAKKSDLTIVYKYKGSVASYAALPESGLNNGDVYNVEDTGINYAWVEETGEWDKLGGHEDLSDYDNKIELIKVKSDSETVETLSIDPSDKSVTVDLSEINKRLDDLDLIISGGEGEGITDLIAGKQDKLENGSSTNPHLIWSSDQKWVPGKINIDDIVPSEGKAANSVLAYDGDKVIWTTVEVQPELPSTNRVAGKILTVSSDGTNVEWADAPNSTTITTSNNISTISNGTESTEVYTKTGVINLLSWQSL